MRADFAVVLDSNVLVESAVSDLFLRLAEEPRLVSPRWTAAICAEAHRTMVSKLGWPDSLAASRLNSAAAAFPEAMITDYESFISQCTNEPNDRHVLAAAIRAKVDTIVTINLRHFLPADLKHWGITAIHPGDYLRVLYDLEPAVVVTVLHHMATLRGKEIDGMLSRLGASVPRFTAHVAADLGINVPVYAPARRSDRLT